MSYDEQRISDQIDDGIEQMKIQDRLKMTHTPTHKAFKNIHDKPSAE